MGRSRAKEWQLQDGSRGEEWGSHGFGTSRVGAWITQKSMALGAGVEKATLQRAEDSVQHLYFSLTNFPWASLKSGLFWYLKV